MIKYTDFWRDIDKEIKGNLFIFYHFYQNLILINLEKLYDGFYFSPLSINYNFKDLNSVRLEKYKY